MHTEEHVTSQQTVPAALIAVLTSNFTGNEGGSASYLKNLYTNETEQLKLYLKRK
jgi:hypothetical protein